MPADIASKLMEGKDVMEGLICICLNIAASNDCSDILWFSNVRSRTIATRSQKDRETPQPTPQPRSPNQRKRYANLTRVFSIPQLGYCYMAK